MKKKTLSIFKVSVLICSALATQVSCSSSSSKENKTNEKNVALPVYTVTKSDAITIKDYLGTIEGKVNVEVRPQVEGLLQEIYVDEGSFVQKGQKLFKVDPSTYQENLKDRKSVV